MGVPGPYSSDDVEARGRVELYHYDADEEALELQDTIETDLPSPEDRCGMSLHMFEDLLSINAGGERRR